MADNGKIDYVLKPVKSARKANAENLQRTDLSLCDAPVPEIIFEGRSFCLTGVFEFSGGNRNQCEEATKTSRTQIGAC